MFIRKALLRPGLSDIIREEVEALTKEKDEDFKRPIWVITGAWAEAPRKLHMRHAHPMIIS